MAVDAVRDVPVSSAAALDSDAAPMLLLVLAFLLSQLLMWCLLLLASFLC
jgi:hypothetical protein